MSSENQGIAKWPDRNSHATASFNTPRALQRLVHAFEQADGTAELANDVRMHSLGIDPNGKEFVVLHAMGADRIYKPDVVKLNGIDAMRAKYKGIMAGKTADETEELKEGGEGVRREGGEGLILEDTDSDGTAIADGKKEIRKKKKNKKKGKKKKAQAAEDRKDEREVDQGLQVEVGEVDVGDEIGFDGDPPTTPPTPKAHSVLVEGDSKIPVIRIRSSSPFDSDDGTDQPRTPPIIVNIPMEEEDVPPTPRATTPILPHEHTEAEGEHADMATLPSESIKPFVHPFETFTDTSPTLTQGQLEHRGQPVYHPELTPPNSPPTTVSVDTKAPLPAHNIVIPLPLPKKHPLPPIPDIEYPLTPPMSANLHPLTHSWTLYYLNSSADKSKNKSSTDYSHNLVKLSTVSTLEDFFGTWKALRRKIAHFKGRAIEPPNQHIAAGAAGLGIGVLPDDTNFNLFREGIVPMWEDPMCAKGGKIILAGNANTMDQLFLEVVLLVIGGTLEDNPAQGVSNMVIGVVVSRRKTQSRLEIWLGGADEPELEWVKDVEKTLQGALKGEKLFPYRSFNAAHAKMR